MHILRYIPSPKRKSTHRWDTEIDKMKLAIYIQESITPDPYPTFIGFGIITEETNESIYDLIIHLKEKEYLIDKIHYSPLKNEIFGELYLPISMLEKPYPEMIKIGIRWNVE